MTTLRHCLNHCRSFFKRVAILLLAMLAVTMLALFTGELVTLPIAVARITEALGAAAADSFVD
jgi:hypothetical protein